MTVGFQVAAATRRTAKEQPMLVKAALVATLAMLGTACGERPGSPPPPSQSTDISGIDWGRDLRLTDHNGRPTRLADFEGKVVMLFFGFTHCPDVCPTTLSDMAQVVGRLGKDGERVQVLFVTVDPERDTPQVLAKYVTAFHPSFLGLYGDAGTTAALAKEFKFHHAAHPADAQGNYAVVHGSSIYVYGPGGPGGPSGRRRLLMGSGRTVDSMTADVARLLR